MADKIYVVRYEGPFAFIKPWTAVRDGETYSQQFLTPSTVEGLRQRLSVKAILRHRLSYQGFDKQTEQTQPRGWDEKKEGKNRIRANRPRSIVTRGILLYPRLHLAFISYEDAAAASGLHICLCRNEDVLLPDPDVQTMTEEEFDAIPGFELIFGEADDAFLVGYNRFDGGQPMYGRLLIAGDPTAVEIIES